MAINYPSFLSPVIFSIFGIQIRWYGLFYAIGFALAIPAIFYLAKYKHEKLKQKVYGKFDLDLVLDYITVLIIGSILTARFFYIVFYNLNFYLANPAEIIAFWHGGMSIHGGITGAILVIYFFAKKRKMHFYDFADVTVIPLAIALSIGRIGNFLNAELVGRLSNVPWAMKFPIYDVKAKIIGYTKARHPSQLYESFKNLLIFVVLMILNKKKQPKGMIFWSFVFSYGILRFLVEFLRKSEIYYIMGLSMGQLLSIPMVIVAAFMIYRIKFSKKFHSEK